jgi:Tol biopolymer transport system component
MAIGPGTRVGPYEVRSLLGSGGMGEVFLAHDDRLRRDVAIKVLPAQFATDPDRLRRFESEARAASQLNHPNILTVFDVGTENGQPYVVSERLEGETLRERLVRGPVAEREALEWARQVARGLAAAHERGIVHRDLKPENLFLTRDGHVKILDFGLAKLSSDGADGGSQTKVQTTYATEPGVIVGTTQYMAPEQVKGQPVDHRADLFAFGVVVYEMLSGKSPFSRPSGAESMSAVLSDTPPPVNEVRSGVSPLVARLVEHCLEKVPEQRFQSARDLLFALDSASTSSGSSARAQPTVAATTAAKVRVRASVMAAAAAVAGLALGWWTASSRPTADGPPRFSRVTKLVATDAAEGSPALSPDGKWMAYLLDDGKRADIYVKFLTGGVAVNLTAGAGNVQVLPRDDVGVLDVSPDGTQIAFAAAPAGATDAYTNTGAVLSSTYVIGAPLGGMPRLLIEGAVGARWSPDGSRLIYIKPGGSAGDALWVADADASNAREILPVSGGVHAHWPSWSADGKYVYYIRSVAPWNVEPSEIYRVPAAGGAAEPFVTTSRRAVYPWPSRDGRGLLYSANPASVDLSLWWKPFDGPAVRVTTGVGDYVGARLSADGRTMVAGINQTRQALAVVTMRGGASQVTFITEGSSGDTDPVVSPGGDRVAFASVRSGSRNIWTSRLDGTDPRQVTSGIAIDERPAWSPDGSKIAFVSSRGDARGIWVVNANGGALQHVLAVQALTTLSWSPDGREIAYAAPAGSVPALFRVPVAGGTPVRIPTPGGATSPAWSAARNVIAYLSVRPGQSALALVTPTGEAVNAPGLTAARFSQGTLAWSADGKHIAGTIDPGTFGTSGIWVREIDSPAGSQTAELGHGQRARGLTWLPDGKGLIISVLERTSDIVLFDQGS